MVVVVSRAGEGQGAGGGAQRVSHASQGKEFWTRIFSGQNEIGGKIRDP